MKTFVLGVDPGTTTGLALISVLDDDPPLAVWSEQLPWDEASDALAKRLEQLRLLQGQPGVRVVAVGEKFIVNAKTAQRGQQYTEDAMGMLGVLRREARLTGVELAPLQAAQPAKNMVPDQALRGLLLYAPGLTHVNDTYRHAVFYAVKAKIMRAKWLLGSEK